MCVFVYCFISTHPFRALVEKYLLEMSRIVSQPANERWVEGKGEGDGKKNEGKEKSRIRGRKKGMRERKKRKKKKKRKKRKI